MYGKSNATHNPIFIFFFSFILLDVVMSNVPPSLGRFHPNRHVGFVETSRSGCRDQGRIMLLVPLLLFFS